MRIAAIVFVYQLPEQCNCLIQQLLHEGDTDVFVHVDKNHEELKKNIIRHERVFVIDNNLRIHWGSDELLTVELMLMKKIVQSSKQYDYVLVLTGTELMVRKGFSDYLSQIDRKVLIERVGEDPLYIDRYERARLVYKWPKVYRRLYNNRYHPFRILRSIHFRMLLKGFPLPKKKINYDLKSVQFYKDWFWCALPIEAVRYIVRFSETETEFMKLYKDSMIPEEGFVTTLLMQSPYRELVSYANGSTENLTFVKTFTNDHPPVLTMDDIADIEASGKYFARKFDVRIDAKVVDYYYKIIVSD